MAKPKAQTPPPLPPDPVGDALADCYAFLLNKLEAKRRATSPSASEPATSSESGRQPEGGNE